MRDPRDSRGMDDFLRRWVRNLLAYFGLYNKDGKVLILGLDNAGKTTLMQMLAANEMKQFAPTQRATHESLSYRGVDFVCFDLGGHREAREVWSDYYVDATAVVYVIDASDRARFEESKQELNSILTDERLKEVTVAVLGNKIDLATAVSEAELREFFGLQKTTGLNTPVAQMRDGTRPLEVFMCSVIARQGYVAPFRWMVQYI